MMRFFQAFGFIIIISTVILIDQFSKQSVIEYFHKNGELENELHEDHIVVTLDCLSIFKSGNLKHEFDGIITESSSESDSNNICDNISEMHLIYRPIVIASFFNLSYVWNHGITFGMFNTHDRSQLFIICVSVVVILYFLYLVRYLIYENIGVMLGCGMIIGGAIANIIDRIKFGAVFDFLDFHVVGYHYPSFNIADAAIVIGVALVCFILCKSKKI